MNKNEPRLVRFVISRRIKENDGREKPYHKHRKSRNYDFIGKIAFAYVNFIVRFVRVVGQ